ncbi:hypothetical protein [Desertivirga arenae]|uniref:hypothetical protein n=1 Tax=Desertivirga arenae TaxID=2810309 RepID=UPI001A978CBC|nr:hypothetical protein [Pedobacter sp. SYSU D00823]
MTAVFSRRTIKKFSFTTALGELDIDGGTRLLNNRVEKGADEVSSTNAPTP